ncbi:uncharacterized protein Tco025E_05085 [Trypanosoma conorhini]|uniref:FYVE-type domain-containing protein n=1 Tax=Trypanosoma conorhini TaxID=83891 RepID=A0A422PGT3_9TRYP|nr:uncharacterized protein Tco025E_05085 [Trypanosoma conorhini]RNF16930.1 hypothetical protein Tco025E_05085 [Trypanosoma conorhini]
MSITGVLPESEWQVPSKTKYCQYQDCGATFGIFSSKTNCRRCGIVLCSSCVCKCNCISGHYRDKPQSVCPRCLEVIERQKILMASAVAGRLPSTPQRRQVAEATAANSLATKHDKETQLLETIHKLHEQLEEESRSTKEALTTSQHAMGPTAQREGDISKTFQESLAQEEKQDKGTTITPSSKEIQRHHITKQITTPENSAEPKKTPGSEQENCEDRQTMLGHTNENTTRPTNIHEETSSCITQLGYERNGLQDEVREARGAAAQLEAQLRQCSVDRERLSDELHATPTGCVRGWTNWHASATACRTRCGRLGGCGAARGAVAAV